MITVTDLAKKKVLEVMDQDDRRGDGLRIEVQNGGTSMAEYGLSFVSKDDHEPDDVLVDAGEFKLHIDPDSAKFLDGATLDFVEGLQESGFKVEAPAAGPPKPAGPLAERVEKIIAEKINPMIASHGGFIDLVGLEDNKAYLRFGGGCQGCGMVNVTLKQGVEVMIKEEVPEIVEILDVTDHANGQNPYYQPGK